MQSESQDGCRSRVLRSLEAHRALSDKENKGGRVQEAVRIAKGVASAATDAVADARAPVPKLRWLLAVELITSGAAFRLFRTHGVPRHFHDADDESVGVSGATDDGRRGQAEVIGSIPT